MTLPKSLTTVTIFSKMLALLLFLAFPLVGFNLGVNYQKKLDIVEFNNRQTPTSFPTSIKSPSRAGWNRYTSVDLDYYLDYPSYYSYNKQGATEVLFEKNLVQTPHGIDNYIDIVKGTSIQQSKAKIDILKNMVVGEKKVVTNGAPLDQFNSYERLADVSINGKRMKAFVNKKPFEVREGSQYYLYLYEGKSDYIIGGLLSENTNSKDNISFKEFNEIVTTMRFLD